VAAWARTGGWAEGSKGGRGAGADGGSRPGCVSGSWCGRGASGVSMRGYGG